MVDNPFAGRRASADPAPFRVALIGTPVAHSLSPVMHNAAYAAMGVDWSYEAFDCPSDDVALEHIDMLGLRLYVGLNVTMPYKRLAAQSADRLARSAQVTDAANVLVMEGEDLVGYNTDGDGIIGALRQADGFLVHGKTVLVCGTGPTAAAGVEALIRSGAARVIVMSRDMDRSLALISLFPHTSATELVPAAYSAALGYMETADAIVDATPLGMKPGDGSPLPAAGFHAGQVALDVVYGHGQTAFIRDALSAGARAFDGLGMLIEQAVGSICIWANRAELRIDCDLSEVMREAALAELARREGASPL